MEKEKLKEQLNFNAQKLKNNKAITLIALVVTIVVLLILAGISISLVVGDNGLIRKSKDAKKQYEEAQANELAMTDEAGDLIDETVTGNLKGTKETKPYLPSGDYTKVPGTSLDNGLVIADKKGNEYVWVEVPRNAEVVYKTAGLNITEFSATELASIKTDLVNYAKDYRASGWDDTWYSGCGIADSGTYTDKYNKMLKSVYQNGGFWIGRYEIGIDENTIRNDSNKSTTTNHTPVIKANKIPYNYITCSQAESLAETFAPSGYTSSLLFGLQWDLVLKHLETKGTNPGTSATSLQNAIKSNSTDWGNYNNANFDITNTDAMYSEDYGASWKKVSEEADKKYQKASNKMVLLTTGAEVRNSMLNICDLAGNLYESTLEKTSITSSPCGSRGGYCFNLGSSNPASNRSYGSAANSNYGGGARVSLY